MRMRPRQTPPLNGEPRTPSLCSFIDYGDGDDMLGGCSKTRTTPKTTMTSSKSSPRRAQRISRAPEACPTSTRIESSGALRTTAASCLWFLSKSKRQIPDLWPLRPDLGVSGAQVSNTAEGRRRGRGPKKLKLKSGVVRMAIASSQPGKSDSPSSAGTIDGDNS